MPTMTRTVRSACMLVLNTTLPMPTTTRNMRSPSMHVLTMTLFLPHRSKRIARSAACVRAMGQRGARRVRRMDSGVLDAARSSMSIFGYEAPPHAEAVRALIVIISGVDSMGKARQHRAADAGAIDAIIRTLTKRGAAGTGVGPSAKAIDTGHYAT